MVNDENPIRQHKMLTVLNKLNVDYLTRNARGLWSYDFWIFGMV